MEGTKWWVQPQGRDQWTLQKWMESNGDTFDKEGKGRENIKLKDFWFLIIEWEVLTSKESGAFVFRNMELILNLDKTLDIILLELSSFSENK